MLAFQLSLQLIILIFVGFLVWRLGMVDEKFDKSLTSLLINIALPCMIIKSFSAPFSTDELINCAILVAISIVYLALCFGLSPLGFLTRIKKS